MIEVLKDIREAPGKIYVKQVVERIKMIGKPVSVDSGPDKVVFCPPFVKRGVQKTRCLKLAEKMNYRYNIDFLKRFIQKQDLYLQLFFL